MAKLLDLVDPTAVDDAVTGGFVRRQTHPSQPLTILNYTEQAVYTRTWTDVTRQCRGLIVNSGTGDVVARPWPKFFNYGEHAADDLHLDASVEVTDKADGSLGILYHDGNGWAVATRGSFMGDQARHATAIYGELYTDRWTPEPGWTYLYEIVYPANRIVLDYGSTDDLILLGAVNIDTGEPVGPQSLPCQQWPGPRIEVTPYATLAEALVAEPRPNAEGLVVRYCDGVHAGTMLKLKQDDYVALHRIITGLTARRLWERAAIFAILAAEPDISIKRLGLALRMDVSDVEGIITVGPDWADEVRMTAQEEFTDWIDATINDLQARALEIVSVVEQEALRWRDMPRKDAAAGIVGHPYRSMVFAALDGKPLTAPAWASIRPESELPFASRSEDNA